jgi:quinohemoprotein ethanol dehydrogenase
MKKVKREASIAMLSAVAFLVAAVSWGQGDDTSTPRLLDSSSGGDWAGYGRTFGEQHFSPLTQINDSNVGGLKLSWLIELPAGTSVSQPIAVDGVLYFVHGQAVVNAVDAATGRALWQYDPKVTEVARHKLRYAWGSRGLAWWKGKIYVGTMDGRLIALDGRTGEQVWSVMTVDRDDHNYITGAPRVFDGKVIIGFGGADVGYARGYVTTYDAETGKQLWRWYTVPGNPAGRFENKAMEMAAKTWSGEWWKFGGGGTVWNAMSYDPETGTVIIGTGNGTPWNHKARSAGKGENLFLASIVALDAKTGGYKWHYQVNPGETWDFTATQDMAFADLSVEGKKRKVLLTAPKNGFFYVIDRQTGQLISAEPFAKVNWASKIDLKTGRPIENPQARYPDGSTFLMWPSDRGAHNWSPMAFSPQTQIAYIPVNEKAATWRDLGVENGQWQQMMPPGTAQSAAWLDLYPPVKDPLDGTSKLLAWNVRTQKAAWSQPTPGPMTGGVMATGGNLVFSGNVDGTFNAYAADTGKLSWSFQTNVPVIAPPITYSVGGTQYVTVLTGPGTGASFLGKPMEPFSLDYRTLERRVLTFSLTGRARLSKRKSLEVLAIQDPEYKPDEQRAQRGALVFAGNCLLCHGFDAVSAGFAPDLRASGVPLSAEAFSRVVKKGALVQRGMPVFGEFSDEQIEDLRAYLRSQAAAFRQSQGLKGTGESSTKMTRKATEGVMQ